mmetsp:Transcript_158279/g.288593  ORF Transcript_158279/g.288593 Transcript_158279/m.288593 type:complete len:251 (-) Transcript_158279:2277-3029(-)
MKQCATITVVASLILCQPACCNELSIHPAPVSIAVCPGGVILACCRLCRSLGRRSSWHFSCCCCSDKGCTATGALRSWELKAAVRRRARCRRLRAISAALRAQVTANVSQVCAAIAVASIPSLHAIFAPNEDVPVRAACARGGTAAHLWWAGQHCVAVATAHGADICSYVHLPSSSGDAASVTVALPCQDRAALVLRYEEVAVSAGSWTLVHTISKICKSTNTVNLRRLYGEEVQGCSIISHIFQVNDDL